MMKMLIGHERYIIQKGKEYLVSRPYDDTAFCRYSISPYDAYNGKSFNTAISVAKKLGGKVVIFNRLTGEIRGGWK